jgi:dienelactone hydrolase
MFYIIDGTGPYNQELYDLAMARSFCWQLEVKFRGYPAVYIPGPGNAGGTTYAKARDGADAIQNYRKRNNYSNSKPIYLAGYSRGGATVIQLAKFLNQQIPKNEVKAMFLFDPVDRDVFLDGQGIPNNVRNVYVVYRDQSIEDVNTPWKPNWGYGERPDKDIYARKWMGNCSVVPDDPNATKVRYSVIKNASHGAAGGSPWNNRAADEAATEAAATDMNKFLQMEGLPPILRDMSAFKGMRKVHR